MLSYWLVPLVAQATEEETSVIQSRDENPKILNIWEKFSFFYRKISKDLKASGISFSS